MDLRHPTKMRVTISGLSESSLRATRVFVYEANSQAPGEYFDPAKSIELPTVRQVRAMFKEPEATLDLAKAKITLDRMVDPNINLEATLQEIDSIVARIRSMPEFGTANATKLEALRRYLYDTGEWNDHRAYQYNLDDPLGHKLSNKLLPTYLATRKGNCVTMPFLFIILGQRLGLTVTASTAPKHFLVKFQSEQYGWINLEATSGGKPARDVWIRQQEPMTDEAVTNGIYLQPLTRRETAAEMATVVAEYYLAQQAYEAAIAVADVILDTYPKDVGTMTPKAVAYGRLAQSHFARLYPSPDQIPAAQQGYFRYLSGRNREWFAKAEALGWREDRPEDQAQYQQRIEKAKQQKSAAN
jgi:regulator of sirC expression with transglutaminase-like and TPR domain